MRDAVPAIRVRCVNDAPLRPAGAYVLYWMTASRRLGWSFALDHAVRQAETLGRPLVILEALRAGYPYASDRLHRFVLDGLAEHAAALAGSPVGYHPYVEPEPGHGAGLLAAMARRACVVVTDDAPVFFLPRMLAAAARRLDVRLEAVDGCGILPLRAVEKTYPTAYLFRRALQRLLPEHLGVFPSPDPLAGAALPPAPGLPAEIRARWPAADRRLLEGDPAALAALPIDHDVAPVDLAGGAAAGRERWERFRSRGLSRYAEERNQLEPHAQSGLSPYLHFGHVSPHQILHELLEDAGWSPERLGLETRGAREGWWGLPPGPEAFLDQLVTWRELGFVCAAHDPDHDRYEGLPAWARATLATHARDPRPYRYDRDALAAADTHDEVWNAAQRQLLRDGTIHGYLRMVWGKKILEWTSSPEQAFAVMNDLNDRWALDGRDPGSRSGIGWCLGRFDRPFGPERPVFGRIRFMSTAATRRKLDLEEYLGRYGD
jgi:deoxyribodipyrimidine photo-lyase